MRSAIALLIVMTLAGCLARPAADPIAAAATPDRQEGGPVTRVVQLYTYEENGDLWYVDISREALGEVGRIEVIGPGPVHCARFFAAKACLQEGGSFRADVLGVVKPLPEGPRMKFVFDAVCE